MNPSAQRNIMNNYRYTVLSFIIGKGYETLHEV